MNFEERMEVLSETAMRKDILIHPETQRIFAYMCSRETDYQALNVIPTRHIAEVLGYSKYRVRKTISILRELGLVERTTHGIPGYETYTENGLVDCDEAHPPINGFGLTKKGYESATYKKAEELQTEEYRAMCGSIEEVE